MGARVTMELAPGIHSIGQSKGGHVHAFLFDDAGELSLVDTLFDKDAHVVLDYIRGLGRSPGDLKRIALTHAHRSHLGGMAELKKQSGATVCSHEWEADIIAGDRLAQPVSLRPQRPLKTYPFQVGIALGIPKHAPCPVDQPLREGDAFGPLQVLHTPGHSPGHLAFHWPERRALIAGDAIATWPELDSGWPAFNLNWTQVRASLARMAAFDAEVVGVGHGEPIAQNAPDRVHELAERPPRS